MCQERPSTSQHKAASLITQDVDNLLLTGGGSDPVRLQWLCVCCCACVPHQQCFPSSEILTGFAGSKDSAEPHDSCSRQRFSTSFIHHMDMEPMLHTEYHMTCMCVRARMCFSYCSRCLAHLWIIIPLWNVTFQTQWPRANRRTSCVCVCRREKSQTLPVV